MENLELPSIKPTTRVFTPGEIPQTVFESQNGSTSFVKFGRKPIKSKLRMTYQNCTEDVAWRLTDFYHTCITKDKTVKISWTNKAVDDMSSADALRWYVRKGGGGVEWLFEKPPTIQANLGGRYNVSIDLIGTLIA